MSAENLEKVLIVDNDSDYRKLVKESLDRFLPDVELIEYDPILKGMPDDQFDWTQFDVLLLDYLSVAGATSLDILHKHHKKPEFPATIMLTNMGMEEVAVHALNLGIYEYQSKRSLTGEKLSHSILRTWQKRLSTQKKQLEITQHNLSFSKEFFYERLGNAYKESQTKKRILVIIRLDKLKELAHQIGIIGRDTLINHVGRQSFKVLKTKGYNPNITKVGDGAVAMQIDYPDSLEALYVSMKGLCKQLEESTFKFSDKKYLYSVSIGLLDLSLFDRPVAELICLGLAAAKKAGKQEGNSYYMWQQQDKLPGIAEDRTDIKPKKNMQKAKAPDTAIALESGKKKLTAKPAPKPAPDSVKAAAPTERERLITKLINEKRILQTYQPAIAMFNDGADNKEIYKTGLKTMLKDNSLNDSLSNPSLFSSTLQQSINEWMLTQVFLHIAEDISAQYRFIVPVTEFWFTEITLFNWLQETLSQTKEYSLGKSIILDISAELFLKHRKRATILLDTLYKTHSFSIALSNIKAVDKILELRAATAARFLLLDIDTLKILSESILPGKSEEEEQNLLQYLQSEGVGLITLGIETSALLTEAVALGTDYAIGSFVGEVQDTLIENKIIESFELM